MPTDRAERWLVAPEIPGRANRDRGSALAVDAVLTSPGEDIVPGAAVVRLEGAARVDVCTPVGGRLVDLRVRSGDDFPAGAVFATMAVSVVDGEHYALHLRDETSLGLTIWPVNPDAFDRFRAPVAPSDLPISPELRATMDRLAHLSSIGWERDVLGHMSLAGDPDDHAWREPTAVENADLAALRRDLREGRLLARLADELGPAYSITHQTGTLAWERRPE